MATVIISPLKKVLQYQNDEVVHRFAKDFGMSISESKAIFLETKKWLWLCAYRSQSKSNKKNRPLMMFSQAAAIDGMWHTFVIFTRDYAKFCDKYFGIFVHHAPVTRKERSRAKLVPIQARRQKLRATYEFIYDHLGEKTLKLWCEDFPRKYPVKDLEI